MPNPTRAAPNAPAAADSARISTSIPTADASSRVIDT